MRLASTFGVLAILMLPSLAWAQCRGDHLDQTAASCLPGMIWDETAGTCVEAPSS